MILLKLSPPSEYKEIQLLIGQPIEDIDPEHVTSLYADGEEKDWICTHVTNIPFANKIYHCVWFGDAAKTIAYLFIQKHKK